MILFYSDYCQHCKMLIDSVSRLDANSVIKLYNIDTFARPKTLSSVPALLTLPDKKIIYGRQVFDHLLLPGRGLLVSNAKTTTEGASTDATSNATATSGEPMGFATMKARTSSYFASIDDNEAKPLGSQSDSWAWMDAQPTARAPAPAPNASTKQGGPFSMETRDSSARALPDISDIMARREQDLRVA